MKTLSNIIILLLLATLCSCGKVKKLVDKSKTVTDSTSYVKVDSNRIIQVDSGKVVKVDSSRKKSIDSIVEEYTEVITETPIINKDGDTTHIERKIIKKATRKTYGILDSMTSSSGDSSFFNTLDQKKVSAEAETKLNKKEIDKHLYKEKKGFVVPWWGWVAIALVLVFYLAYTLFINKGWIVKVIHKVVRFFT